jgi:hypothetical protein
MRKLADIERERALNDSEPQPPHGAKNYITPAGYARLKNEPNACSITNAQPRQK